MRFARGRQQDRSAFANLPTSKLEGATTMINVTAIDELARRLADLVPPGARDARDELAANFRDALRAGLRRLDLVTREEFDVQRGVLLRTREKIETLEAQVAALETMSTHSQL
jgi:ubiquinone biosynthesis accessory factor UbiK